MGASGPRPDRRNGYHICTTKVDFLIYHDDGSKELVEVKGFETPDYRIKKKLIEAVFLHDHPAYTYTVVNETWHHLRQLS